MNELIYKGRPAKRIMEKYSLVRTFTELGIDYINHRDYDSIVYDGGIRDRTGDWQNSIGEYTFNQKVFESTGLEWTPN